MAETSQAGYGVRTDGRIALTGFMGAGKSTVGRLLAEALGWTFVDLDEEIVRTTGQSIAEIFEIAGEVRFRQIEHQTLAETLRRPGLVLALGGGALEMQSNRDLLAGDPALLLIYLEAPLPVLIERCERHGLQPGAARRPVLEKRAELAERFARRRPFYEQAALRIDAAQLAPVEIVAEILAGWQKRF